MVKNGIYSFCGGFSMGKILLPLESVETLEVYHSSTSSELRVKEAHITSKKPKEELKPFYTNF
jgi:hypothetical protein